MMDKKRCGVLGWPAFVHLIGAMAVCAGSSRIIAGGGAVPPETSRPYTVTVSFVLASPFVPDGRSSIAVLELRAVFTPVVLEFDPDGNPLLGRCQLDTGRVKGVFTKFILNDVQKGEERRTPAFLTPRPADFRAGIGIESEPTADDESAATSHTPPAKVRLSFWTDFGAAEIKWGSALGTGVLENLKTVFEAPFRDLMAGHARTVTHRYEGKYPEDKGTWKIEFTPGMKNGGTEDRLGTEPAGGAHTRPVL